MNKKICIAVAILLTCTSTLSIIHKESNVGATMSTEKITYCFLRYDPNEAWQTYPEGMLCDGENWASTMKNGDVELLTDNILTDNACYNPIGTITKVELETRGYYYWWGDDRDIILRPVFPTADGDNHVFDAPGWSPGSSGWIDITNDTNAPDPWTWTNVITLDCDVEAENKPFGGWFILFCSTVYIRVTYTHNNV